METLHFQIKKKSPIGQQLVHAWDNDLKKWVQETSYGHPQFTATHTEAVELLKRLKADSRGLKWMRLYRIIG